MRLLFNRLNLLSKHLILLDKTFRIKKKYSFIKTHSIFYPELITLYKMNSGAMGNDMEIEEDNDDS